MCAVEHAAIDAAENVFITLTQEGNDLFMKHLMGYAFSESSFRMV